MSHLNVLRRDSRGPMERSKVNSILNINVSMPRNEFQKANKESKTPMKASQIKASIES